MKFKKILLLLLIFILFLYNANVFATFDFTYNDVNYSYPDFPTTYNNTNLSYYIIYKYPGLNYTTLFASDCPMHYLDGYGVQPSVSGKYVYMFRVNNGGTKWSFTNSCGSNTYFSSSPGYFIYASSPVYSTTGDIVFQNSEYYDNYPYFLNSEEDIAQGDKDLIIMPRRFCK